LEGTGVNPAKVESLGEEITVGQQLRQNRNVNAVAPPGWGLVLGARLETVSHGVLGFAAVSAPTLRDTLEPLIGKISRNEYFTVENREGFARPSRVPQTAAAGSSTR
jgi:hypothetical protein